MRFQDTGRKRRKARRNDPFPPPRACSLPEPSLARPNVTGHQALKMWRRLLETAAILAAAGAVDGGVIRYDQSQTGDYNIHLDLKNVDFLAFLDDSSSSYGGEYDYDYGELTLKPPAGPSSATLNSTEGPVVSSTEKTEATSSNAGPDSEAQVTSTPAGPTKPARRCGAGFYRDANGRCRRLRRPGPGIKLSGLLNQAKNKISG